MNIGILDASEICYASLKFFLDSIEQALRVKGITTYRITDFNYEVLQQKYDAIVGLNSSFCAATLADGSYLMDYFQCPFFNILLDPPYYHHGALNKHMENMHVICLDRGHVEYCKRYYPPCKSVEQGYLLGPLDKVIPYEEKEIDLLFMGSCADEAEILQQAKAFYNMDWADYIIENLIANSLKNPNIPMEQQMKIVLEQGKINVSESDFVTLMSTLGQYAEFYLRGYYRKKIIQALVDAGVQVHVAGTGWEELAKTMPNNLILEGVVDFAKSAQLIAKSKICLNVMPWFKDGIHDRVLTAMHNGTICLSDSSLLCTELFRNGENIMFYSLEHLDELPGIVKAILDDERKAKEIVTKGMQCGETYNWNSFVQKYILQHLYE